MMLPIGISLATAALSAAALAQTQLPAPFNTGDCPTQTAWRWCASKAKAEGWVLRYQSVSPANLMDLAWRTEIWVRAHQAVLCEYRAGRAGVGLDTCQALDEVGQ
jgi:hypothetical protein